jgi:hypothetical protein
MRRIEAGLEVVRSKFLVELRDPAPGDQQGRVQLSPFWRWREKTIAKVLMNISKTRVSKMMTRVPKNLLNLCQTWILSLKENLEESE